MIQFIMADLTDNTNFNRGTWLWFRISGTSIRDLTTQVQSVWDTDQFVYMYAQFEHTESFGMHLQGYAVSKTQLRKKSVMEAFAKCPKYAFGPLSSNKDKIRMAEYCRKEQTRIPKTEAFERGTCPGGNAIKEQDKRDNIKEILAEHRKGVNSLRVKEWARDNAYTWAEIALAEGVHVELSRRHV